MLLPLLGLDLHLSLMTSSIGGIHVLLADEFLSWLFAVGVVNVLEDVEGLLVATFGRNLPVTDCNFVVAKAVFGAADVVTSHNVSSQRANSPKQSGPFLIDSYSVTLVVAIPNKYASLRRTEFNGPDVEIKCRRAEADLLPGKSSLGLNL